MMRFVLPLVLAAIAIAQPMPDSEVWDEYVKWSDGLKALPPGQRLRQEDLYAKSLAQRGVMKDEADRRFKRIQDMRRTSPEREKVYWNAAFKLGAGPDDPSRLVQEAVYKVKPGRALDAGMGRGRDAVWLASVGWDVTGYDVSPDALKIAEAHAQKTGVKIKTVEASHDTFDFGESQWDLILCSNNFMSIGDRKWHETFMRALRPGGLVLFQGAIPEAPNEPLDYWTKILARWVGYKLIRFENLDPGLVENDWPGHMTSRTIRVILRKPR